MKLIGILAAAVVAALPLQTAPTPVVGLENEPITFIGPAPWSNITAESFAFDSLRVVVLWTHPADSLGLEDSTVFRIKATKAIRFMGGGTVAAGTWKRRNWSNKTLADTFKVLRPAIGDSVIFTADSITQFRKGAGSVPGSAAWGYQRSAAPPAMTFIRVTTDSF